MDFYPTLAELALADQEAEQWVARASAEATTAQPIDGVSLVPVLTGTDRLEREVLFWHFPCYVGRSRPASAVRVGAWKLIEWFEDESLELYELR
jgi:arylsulfatase A-like enzyme